MQGTERAKPFTKERRDAAKILGAPPALKKGRVGVNEGQRADGEPEIVLEMVTGDRGTQRVKVAKEFRCRYISAKEHAGSGGSFGRAYAIGVARMGIEHARFLPICAGKL